MQIVCKKTTELTQIEKEQICKCFEDVFEKHSRSLDEFENVFLNTCKGYSLHTMLKTDEDEIVGLYTVVPFDYIYQGQKQLFCIGVDFMIRKDHRDDFRNVMNICRSSMKYTKDNGISCIFAFPNDLSYQLNTRILRMKDVGKLYTYILPYKVGAAKPSMKVLNPCSMLFSHLMLGCSSLDMRSAAVEAPIHRDRTTFDETRYKWFDPEAYRFCKDDKMSCTWKCADFEGIKAAFLMDVYPMSSRNFNKAVKEMFKAEKKNVGICLYVGNLPFAPSSMVKIPLKVAPKNFNFVAQILDKDAVAADEIFNMNNWDINLSSYDLL